LEKGKSGEIHNISSGSELSNVEVVKRILKLIGKPDKLLTFVEDRLGHDLRYSLDSSKIRSMLGWKPRFAFEKCLETTVNSYVKNEPW